MNLLSGIYFMYKWTNGRTDKRMDGRMDGRTLLLRYVRDGRIYKGIVGLSPPTGRSISTGKKD